MYDHKTKKNTIRSVSEYKIFIFGSKATENKTKKERINFLVVLFISEFDDRA